MPDRVNQGVKAPPQTLPEMERFLANLNRTSDLTPEQLNTFARQVEAYFPGGFDQRDEANAIVCLAIRNGPIENLHAGQSSPLLEDDNLSRITDDEMKTLMIHASRMIAFLLWFKDAAPDAYKRYLQACGMRYCRKWERAK